MFLLVLAAARAAGLIYYIPPCLLCSIPREAGYFFLSLQLSLLFSEMFPIMSSSNFNHFCRLHIEVDIRASKDCLHKLELVKFKLLIINTGLVGKQLLLWLCVVFAKRCTSPYLLHILQIVSKTTRELIKLPKFKKIINSIN